ncbi:MAG: hypothetical protein WA185_04970 [Candidatus Acidiferrales bacterium]
MWKSSPRFGEQLRFHDFGMVVVGVAIVVLEGGERLAKGNSRDEDDADPVVNEAAGNRGAGGRGRGALIVALDEDLAVREIGVGLVFLRGREGVDIEEVLFRGEVASGAGFFGGDILVKGSRGFGSELRGGGWPGRKGGAGEQSCGKRMAFQVWRGMRFLAFMRGRWQRRGMAAMLWRSCLCHEQVNS